MRLTQDILQGIILLSLCRKYVYIVGRKGKGHNNYEKEIIRNIADPLHGTFHDAEYGICDEWNNWNN